MNNPISVLLLAPPGESRDSIIERLIRLGCRVADRAPGGAASAADGELVVLDLRVGVIDAALVAELYSDPRPIVLISEQPTDIVRQLAGRPAGTMFMTGAEEDAGYRVALSVGRGLGARRERAERRRFRARRRVEAARTESAPAASVGGLSGTTA